MIKTMLAAALMCSMLASAPAHAVIFQFYEGNNCTQARLGAVDVETVPEAGFAVNLQRYGHSERAAFIFLVPFSQPFLPKTWNDEVRSVRVLSNWRVVREASAPSLTMYDNPDGRTNDDWVKIHVRDATRIPDRGACIGSLERSFDREGIYLERHPNNGLDGKVSRLRVDCDRACKASRTRDPNARR